MQILYTAPNRGHHYIYAEAFYKASSLEAFVSGFSSYSPRANDIEIGNKLYRADFVQNIYLASLKYKLPKAISDELAYRAKIEQDNACKKFLNKSDVFMFYNGSGLNTLREAKKKAILTIVEAVNSHVDFQETILRNEYEQLKLPWIPFHKKEKQRRILEYEEADYILMPSEFVKKSFLTYGFAERKLLKVPYGFNQLNTSAQRTHRKKETFTILYVGSISVRKGIRYLLEAYQKISVPGKRLVITGPVTHPAGFESLPIDSTIIFTGILKGKDLENVYAGADVFCLPSIEEGLALVLGEALSFGLPIIATENSGACDIITDREEGFIVPIKSPDAIAEKIEWLAKDEAIYAAMRKKAKERAASLNGWNETQQQLVKTISHLHA